MSLALIDLIRAAHYAALMLLVGAPAFVHLVAAPVIGATAASVLDPLRRWTARLFTASLAVAALTALLWLGAEAIDMSGLPPAQALSAATIGTVLGATQFGRIWSLRLALIGLIAGLLLLRASGRRGPKGFDAITGLLPAVLLVTLAWAGHAAAAQGATRPVHLGAHILHLAAAALWLGGLVPLGYVLREAGRDAARRALAQVATRRFSILAALCVAALIASGLVNTGFMVPTVAALVETPYGRVLLLKLALFAVMLAIAADNRFRLTPRLLAAPAAPEGATAAPARQLWRNVLVETGLGLAVLVAVGALGVMPPPMGMHPMAH